MSQRAAASSFISSVASLSFLIRVVFQRFQIVKKSMCSKWFSIICLLLLGSSHAVQLENQLGVYAKIQSHMQLQQQAAMHLTIGTEQQQRLNFLRWIRQRWRKLGSYRRPTRAQCELAKQSSLSVLHQLRKSHYSMAAPKLRSAVTKLSSSFQLDTQKSSKHDKMFAQSRYLKQHGKIHEFDVSIENYT